MKPFRDPTTGQTWANPRELIDHIVTNHHDHLRMTLPELDDLADRVADEASVPAHVKDRLQAELMVLAERLDRHLSEQESCVFPLIRHLDEAAGTTEWAYELGDNLEWMVDRLSRENQELSNTLDQVRQFMREAGWSENAAATPDSVAELRVLCDQLPRHIRLEADVLCPWVKQLLQEEGLLSARQYW